MAYTWDTVPQEFPDVVNGIEPSTQCWVTRMPHTGLSEDWLCAPTQDTFLTWCNKYVVAKSNDFSYQRTHSVIRFPANAEYLSTNGGNYVAFRNTDYGNMWWFAFIDRIEYRNPNVSWLHIRIDVLNTWFPSLQKSGIADSSGAIGTSQYYLRWTPKWDRYLEWLQPDPTVSYDPESSLTTKTEAITEPILGNNLTGDSQGEEYFSIFVQAVTGHEENYYALDHIPNGTETYVYSTQEELNNGILHDFEWTGDITNSQLLGFYLVPTHLFNNTSSEGYWGIRVNIKSNIELSTGDKFPSYGSQKDLPNVNSYERPYFYPSEYSNINYDYTPLNYKLYTYPYVAIKLKNGGGEGITLAFERFTSKTIDDGTLELYSGDKDIPAYFRNTTKLEPNSYALVGNAIYPCNPCIYPINYRSASSSESILTDYDMGIQIGELPSLNITAANKGGQVLGIINGVVNTALGIAGAIATGGTSLTYTETIGTGVLNAQGQEYTREESHYGWTGKSPAQTNVEISGSVTKGVQQILGSLFPEKTVYDGSVKLGIPQQFNNGCYGAFIDKIMCPAPVARQIDEYFSLYGYSMNCSLRIDFMTMTHDYFDYYQTANASFWLGGSSEEYGYMTPPEEHKQQWNKIFDQGVRIWWDRGKFGQKDRYVFILNDMSTIHTS